MAIISSPYPWGGTSGQNQGPIALRHDNISLSFRLFRSHSCFACVPGVIFWINGLQWSWGHLSDDRRTYRGCLKCFLYRPVILKIKALYSKTKCVVVRLPFQVCSSSQAKQQCTGLSVHIHASQQGLCWDSCYSGLNKMLYHFAVIFLSGTLDWYGLARNQSVCSHISGMAIFPCLKRFNQIHAKNSHIGKALPSLKSGWGGGKWGEWKEGKE